MSSEKERTHENYRLMNLTELNFLKKKTFFMKEMWDKEAIKICKDKEKRVKVCQQRVVW